MCRESRYARVIDTSVVESNHQRGKGDCNRALTSFRARGINHTPSTVPEDRQRVAGSWTHGLVYTFSGN